MCRISAAGVNISLIACWEAPVTALARGSDFVHHLVRSLETQCDRAFCSEPIRKTTNTHAYLQAVSSSLTDVSLHLMLHFAQGPSTLGSQRHMPS